MAFLIGTEPAKTCGPARYAPGVIPPDQAGGPLRPGGQSP
jgi:hypothetical protein